MKILSLKNVMKHCMILCTDKTGYKDALRQHLCSQSTQGNKNQWPSDLDDESEWMLIKFTYDTKVEGLPQASREEQIGRWPQHFK